MNAIRLATIMMLSAAPAWVYAQSAQTLSDGKSFAESIAPQTPGQIVNPSGVNQTAWSAGSMAVPSGMPAGLGSFSSPPTSSPLYDVNGAQGALSGLGNARIQACKNYVPTGDPIADQECAAVKFMNKDCVILSSAQLQVIGSAGATAGTGTNCADTYGSGQSNFGYQNAITTSDPIFHLSQTAQAGASAATSQNCVSTPVVTTPAQYETNTCSKTVSTDAHTCTQELAVAVTTSYNPANIFYTCSRGTLQGSYCVSATSVAASVSYSCANGSLSGSSCVSTSGAPAAVSYSCPSGTLSGSTCYNTSSTPASVSYSCPTGTLSGTMCVSDTGSPAAASYTCPDGGSLSGSSCISQTTQPASVYYSCGTGSYLNGNACYSDSAAQVTASCPPGVPILKGQNGQPDLCAAQYYVEGADCNAQPSGGGYIMSCTWPAPQSYSCPSGGTLSGSTCTKSTTATLNYQCGSGALSGGSCVVSSSAPATPVYSCGSGTLVGTQCVTGSSTPADASFSCSAGTLSGSQCMSSSTSAANAMYYCNSGTLSGSQCISASSTPATANYYCPDGAILNGQACVTTTQTNATMNYSCPTGSTPVGSQCKNVLTQTQWLDNCVPYEQSAGITLGAPK